MLYPSRQEPAREREEKIEHFFDGKRPKDIPVGRKMTFLCLQHIHAKSQRREQSATEASRFGQNYKVFYLSEMKNAQDCQEQKE